MYSRITVVSDDRRVDLALPAGVPLSSLLPALLRMCVPAVTASGDARSWALSRVGAGPLPLEASLRDVGVRDGDILTLSAHDHAVRPAYVEEFLDTLQDSANKRRRWDDGATRLLATLAFAVAGLAILVTSRLPWDSGAASVLMDVGVAAVCLVLSWLSTRAGRTVETVVLAASGLPWAGAAGWVSTGLAGGSWQAALAVAGAAATVSMVIGWLFVPRLFGLLVGVGVLAGMAAAVVIALSSGAPLLHIAAVAALVIVVAIGIAPRVSVGVGGLTAADLRMRNGGALSVAELDDRLQRSASVLTWTLVSLAGTGAAALAVLHLAANPWARALGAILTLTLLLRSRTFTAVPHVAPVRVAGLLASAALVVRLSADAANVELQFAVIGGALVVLAGLVAGAGVELIRANRARLRIIGNLCETISLVAAVPLLAGTLGLFDWVTTLGA